MDYNVSFPGLGLEFTVNPVAFTIGNYPVYWYGIIIASGLLLAVLYAYVSSKRYNVDGNKLINCILVGIITGIIGARLYYCFFEWDYYGKNPIEILYINNGGLAIYGGIIGALLGGLTVAKIQKMKVMPILDIAMMGFLLGQGIGRWGNFMNQEAFGAPTDLPWGMVSQGTDNVAVHPCFFYRMIVEGLRSDSLYLHFEIFGNAVKVSQLLSAVIFVAGIVMLLINIKRKDSFYADYRRKKGIGSGKARSKK